MWYDNQCKRLTHRKVNITKQKQSSILWNPFYTLLSNLCRTNLGRARAWIRLALMQKKLADYLKVLIDLRDTVLHEFYEPGSLLLSEDAVVLLGLLLGLNVVDCNLCLKVYLRAFGKCWFFTRMILILFCEFFFLRSNNCCRKRTLTLSKE